MTTDADPEIRALLEQVRATPCIQSAIARLGDSLDPAAAVLALDRARRELDEHCVTVLLMALAAAGRLPASAAFVPALALIDELDRFAAVLTMSPDDPSAALLDLLEGDTLSVQRECVALLVLAERHRRHRAGQPADPRLCKLLRKQLRASRRSDELRILGMAVDRLDDPGMTRVAEELGRPPASAVFEQRAERLLQTDWRKVVPEREAPEVQVGTARRQAPKVQRNDPCPCGSGRKFKKCCFGKGGVAEIVTVEPPQASPDYSEMRPAQIARLDLTTLDRVGLVTCLRVALRFRQWDLAERLMSALDEHLHDPAQSDEFRLELCLAAASAGAGEVVERHRSLAHDPGEIANRLGLEAALLQPDQVTTVQLEAKAAAGLQGDADALYQLAYGLLDHSPALGILVARGALDPGRPFDSWQLVEDIERARDALLLPPGDPATATYERMVADHAEAARERAEGIAVDEMARSLTATSKALESTQREAAALQRRMEEANRRIELLERQAASATEAAPTAPTSAAPAADLRPELVRLRTRVTELKGLVTENLTRRKALERQLENRRDTTEPSHTARPPSSADSNDDAHVTDEVFAPRAVCVTVFAEEAATQLRRLDRATAARIVRAIGLVAAADPGAWREVKALRAAHGHLRLRVGQYRVLFREDVERQELHVGQIVVRGELESAVKRLG